AGWQQRWTAEQRLQTWQMACVFLLCSERSLRTARRCAVGTANDSQGAARRRPEGVRRPSAAVRSDQESANLQEERRACRKGKQPQCSTERPRFESRRRYRERPPRRKGNEG